MNKIVLVLILAGLLISIPLPTFAQTTIQSTSASLDVRVAPGEILPISVKLSNFGGGKRVDVTINYSITSDKDVEIYKTSETVAVETTNSFIKNIQVPTNTNPGIFTAKTSIVYQGQITPAVTEFTFTVERKILGIFQNQFLFYGGITLCLGVGASLIVYNLTKHRNPSRFSPIDYSNIPHKDRVFYELLSDTVMNMRHKVGNRALEIASGVKGLTIDKSSGRIIKLTQSPSKIIAELVLGYEKALGEKISFSFRR